MTPLPSEMARCMGYGYKPGEFCEQRDNCKRHLTMKVDEDWNIKPWYRLCDWRINGYSLQEK